MDSRELMLKELTEASGLPGYEGDVRDVMRKYIDSSAEIELDNLGSLIARKVGQADGPKVMLAGHMDEVGFMVKSITKEGFLKFQPLGGWWDQVLLAQRVVIKTRKGAVQGIIGSVPPHVLSTEAKNKVVEKKDMFIDIGACSDEEARGFGVRPGDPIVPDSLFTILANPSLYLAKAWDNRVGCALGIDVVRELAQSSHPNVLYAVGTTQEEIGLRGAQTSAQYIKPDVALALEVGIAADVPGGDKDKAQEELGKGPVVLLYDRSLVPNIRLRDMVVDIAEECKIPFQYDSMDGGGTDAGAMNLVEKGVPSLVLAVPTRYIHSHAGIISRTDYDNTLRLLVELVKRLDWTAVRGLTVG